MSSSDDFHAAKIVLSLNKALQKPQILPYLREQIIRDMLSNFDSVTDEEVYEYLESRK